MDPTGCLLDPEFAFQVFPGSLDHTRTPGTLVAGHGGLNENTPNLWAPMFEYLIPRWWNCLGLGGRGFVCRWGSDFKASEDFFLWVDPHVSSLLSLLKCLCSARMDSNKSP